MEIDLRRELVPMIQIRKRIYKMEYEGSNVICFECGCYGHRESDCKVRREANVEEDSTGDRKRDKDRAINGVKSPSGGEASPSS